MSSTLEQIVASKRKELAEAQERVPPNVLAQMVASMPPVRDFRKALERPGEVSVIAEIKKASPSAGLLREAFDPVAMATTYETHGAACISVLTDGPFFQGSLLDLTDVRDTVGVPVLRKDFILDNYQLLEARMAGADAVLLIAEILDGEQLARLHQQATAIGLQTLVELHEPANLSRVLDSGASLIGVNNRNLQTFETRLEQTLELASQIPSNCCLVSESGVRCRADVHRLQSAGVRAVLVGETLMRAADPGSKLDELRGVKTEAC